MMVRAFDHQRGHSARRTTPGRGHEVARLFGTEVKRRASSLRCRAHAEFDVERAVAGFDAIKPAVANMSLANSGLPLGSIRRLPFRRLLDGHSAFTNRRQWLIRRTPLAA